MATFSALENASMNNDTSDIEIESLMIDVMTEQNEFNAAVEELETFATSSESYFEATAATENLVAQIEEYGISRGMMKAVDPEGFWTNALGISSYDELDVAPAKDNTAHMAVEKMSDTLKKWGENIKKFFKKIVDMIKGIISKAISLFQKQEKVIKKTIEKLKKVSSLDDDKLKDKKVNTVSKKTMVEFIGEVSAAASQATAYTTTKLVDRDADKISIAKEIEKITIEKSLDLFGFELNDDKDGLKSADKPRYDEEKSEKSLKDLGYTKTGDAVDVLEAVLKLLANTKQFEAAAKQSDNFLKGVENKIKSLETGGDSGQKEAKASLEKAKKAMAIYQKYMGGVLKMSKTLAGDCISVGNKMIACEKK